MMRLKKNLAHVDVAEIGEILKRRPNPSSSSTNALHRN